jgi:arabinogalactan oligomer/maltooligosaccharide transport system substrate-binding protein
VWENLPPAQFQQLQQDIETFQQQYPYYKIEVQHYPSPESFMTAAISGQSNFEVVLASPVLLGNLQAAGQIAPMSNFFPAGFMDNFIAGPLIGARRDNNIWGLPETAGFHLLLFYNRAMINTPPATTTELADMAHPFTTDPKWGLGLNSYDPLWLIPWLSAYGGSLTDEASQPALNSPAMVRAITLLVDWRHTIAPMATYDEMQEGFANGKGAMMINGDWALGELDSTLNLDWGVALLPAVSGGEEGRLPAPLVLGKYWAVSTSVTGERAQAASAFLDYVTRPERQLTWAAKFGQLPTRREALNDPAMVNDPVMRTSAAQMQAGQTLPLGINPNALLEAMRNPLRAAIDGTLTPEQAAQQMQENLAQ